MACAADPARTVCDLRDRQHVLMGYRSGVALLLLAASATASATERIVTLAPHLAELVRSEEHTSELQSLMRISYAVYCFKKKKSNILRLTRYTHFIYKPFLITFFVNVVSPYHVTS